VYQRGSLLDGLAMYLSCDTKKFHDNESTHILHNFWTSTHGGEASPFPLAAPLRRWQRFKTSIAIAIGDIRLRDRLIRELPTNPAHVHVDTVG